MSPSRVELLAAADRVVPDVVAEDLRVLFCGINPGLYTAWAGHHFARPGNRFWPALHASGFTPRLLRPAEEQELLALGLGVTNVVARATATAAELSPRRAPRGRAPARRAGGAVASGVRRGPRCDGLPGGVRASRVRCWDRRTARSEPPGSGCCRTRAGSTRTTSPRTWLGSSGSCARRYRGDDARNDRTREDRAAERDGLLRGADCSRLAVRPAARRARLGLPLPLQHRVAGAGGSPHRRHPGRQPGGADRPGRGGR